VAGLRTIWRHTAAIVRQEFTLLVLVTLLAGSLWAFLAIADEVTEGETHAVDVAILLSLRDPDDSNDPLGPGWVEELGRDATALGGLGVLIFITLASVVYLMLRRKRRAALFLAAAIAGGMVLSFALKSGFDRPRPDLVPHDQIVYTSSFPSGHSMMSALVYLTLGALLARMQPNRRLKIFFFVLAAMMTLFVGISRIYLGVHWPTDVLAGWAAGAAWAMLCWLVVLWMQRRHQMEPSADVTGQGGQGEEI